MNKNYSKSTPTCKNGIDASSINNAQRNSPSAPVLSEVPEGPKDERRIASFMIVLALIFSYGHTAFSQYFPGRTFVVENTVHVPGVTDATQVNSLPNDDWSRSVTYYDKLGRPTQSQLVGQSPTGKNVVQHYEYDGYGRATTNYLPYTSPTVNGGDFRTNASNELNSFYSSSTNKVATDANYYSVSEIEESPLARVLSQAKPGMSWQSSGRIVRYEYGLNKSADNVYKWEITPQGDLKLSSSTHYAANTLTVTVVKGENWVSADGNNGTSRSFKDHLGNTVLKRSYNSGQAYDTYYVYDDFGNLRFILPPEATSELGSAEGSISQDNIFTTSQTFPSSKPKNQVYYYMPSAVVTLPQGMTFTTGFELKPYPVSGAFMEKWMYVNVYDDKNRLTQKKVPGADWVYYVYDKSGRLIMSQDGNQRKNNEWTFTKYDVHNRPVLTGVKTDNRSRSVIQNEVESVVGSTRAWYETLGGNVHGYTNSAYPDVSDVNSYLVVTYYDDYSFMNGWGAKYDFNSSNGVNNGPRITIGRGLETGGKVKVLGTNTWLKAVKYYDKDHNVIQTVADHYNDEVEKTYAEYDFTGQLLRSRFEHVINLSKAITIDERFEYDHTGRLLKHWHSVSGHPEVLLAKYEYNGLGQVVDKKLHSTDDGASYMQSVDYRYNIRGWVTNINNAARNTGATNDDTDDVFGMEMYYNATSANGLTLAPQYNGNIAGTAWSNNRMDNQQRSYAYSYDKLGQLTAANYRERTASGWNAKSGHYDEDNITYDKNGNIKTLRRKHSINNSATVIDNLTYTYEGNQLVKADDASNHEMGFKDGANTAVEYEYDANGNLTRDRNKLIQSITYNQLNRPDRITFESGDYIEYAYTAGGQKLVQKVYVNGQLQEYTDYSSGLIFKDDILVEIAMPQGRIKVDVVGNDYNYDYQYVIADHLGNSRAMVAPETRVYTAYMETPTAAQEEAQFLNVAKTRITDANYNHTPTGTVSGANKSAMLNATKDYVGGGGKRIVGPAKAIKVYGGDQVEMEVWTKYAGVASSTTNTSTLIFDAIASAYGLSPSGPTEALYSAMNTFFGGASLVSQGPSDRPAAYLEYIYYDKNFQNTPVHGFAQVPTSGSSFQKLSLNFNAPGEGYLFIYVINQSRIDRNVYFDDFQITHTSSANVLQADDYYPFGLAIENNNFTESGVEPNRFLYQGKEWQTQLALNLYDFHARHYDPALGRWHNIDPKSQFASPYLAMGNNPIMMVDPDGQEALALVIIGAVVGAYIGGAAANGGELNPIQWNYSDFNTYLGIVVGGAVGAFTGNVAYWGVVKGTMKLSLAYAVPGLGSIGLVGNSTNWFQGIQWTSNGGGQGNIDFDNDVEWGNIISGTNEDFNVYTGGYRQTQYNDELQDWIYTKLLSNHGYMMQEQTVGERYNRNFLGTYDRWTGEYGMYVSVLNGVWDSFGLGFSSTLHQARPVGWGPGDWAYATGKTRAILNSPVVKFAGKAFGFYDIYEGAMQIRQDPTDYRGYVKVGVNGALFFMKSTNPWGWGASLGYTILDETLLKK